MAVEAAQEVSPSVNESVGWSPMPQATGGGVVRWASVALTEDA